MFRTYQSAATRAMLALAVTAAVSACAVSPGGGGADAPEPGVFSPTRDGPEGAAEGTCWGRTVSAAVVERVSERVEVTPAKFNPDGTVASLPVYRTEDKQVIVTPRRDNWFETPCPDVLTPDFISSLQRALQARGIYGGAISGVLDDATRAAVLTYQRAEGPQSTVLSLQSARALGLIAVPRQPSE